MGFQIARLQMRCGERIDWTYVLGLELTDPGFDYSVLRFPRKSGQ
jgi:hypothetical protein